MSAVVTVIGSGSSGNAYALDTGEEILLFECGLKKKEILRGIGYQTSRVSGLLISHEHKDHCGHMKEMLGYGFPVVASREVSSRLDELYGLKATPIKRNAKTKLGSFTVVPFQVPHDGTECDGFLCFHPAFGKMVFMTDLEFCPYDLSGMGLNAVLIECNYSARYLDSDLSYKNHIVSGHMELQTCRRFIEKVSNDNLKNVMLLHLSGGNADGAEFQNSLVNSCPEGCTLSVAYPGLKITIGG